MLGHICDNCWKHKCTAVLCVHCSMLELWKPFPGQITRVADKLLAGFVWNLNHSHHVYYSPPFFIQKIPAPNPTMPTLQCISTNTAYSPPSTFAKCATPLLPTTSNLSCLAGWVAFAYSVKKMVRRRRAFLKTVWGLLPTPTSSLIGWQELEVSGKKESTLNEMKISLFFHWD